MKNFPQSPIEPLYVLPLYSVLPTHEQAKVNTHPFISLSMRVAKFVSCNFLYLIHTLKCHTVICIYNFPVVACVINNEILGTEDGVFGQVFFLKKLDSFTRINMLSVIHIKVIFENFYSNRGRKESCRC